MNSELKKQTIGDYFKASKILFGAFIAGVINFGIVVFILFSMDLLPLGNINPDLTIYLIIGSLLLFILMHFIGSSIFKSRTDAAKSELNFSKKLSVYREAKIIQLVTLEASALVAIVFLLIITHVAFLVIAFISLAQMIRIFPKKKELIESLNLNYSHQNHLENPNFVIE